MSHTHTHTHTQSHAGKVVLRGWYERNKHIFPASRLEPYDPEKKWDKYTVSGTNCGLLFIHSMYMYISFVHKVTSYKFVDFSSLQISDNKQKKT